jgi:cobalt-zinc-cadmium efflux system outer membrane protein
MTLRTGLRAGLLLATAHVAAHGAAAQTPLAPRSLSRAEAVDMALARGGRIAIAGADTAAATAALLVARARPNPNASASYSRSEPQAHASLDLPFDLPGVRRTRIGGAAAQRDAARLTFLFARASVALDADTTYTRALAARERALLSRRTARDAERLRAAAAARRDAGDASDLDVELASVNAGRAANDADADSLAYVDALADLRVAIADTSAAPILLADSLSSGDSLPASEPAIGPIGATPASSARGTPLQIAAAERSFVGAQLGSQLARREVYGVPSVSVGAEWRDPSAPGLLPTVGVSIPIPLFDRGRGAVAVADAARARAAAELALARTEGAAQVARARRARDLARVRVARDRRLLQSAERVASLSLTGYREGALSLADVVQAQRDARDTLAQFVNDLAAARIAAALFATYTLGAP